MTSAMLEGRLTTPLDLRAQAWAWYVLLGVRPVYGQLAGVTQVLLMHAPPAAGHSVRL